MSIIITNAETSHSASTSLINTLGYPVTFKVSLESCAGVPTYTSAPETLASGHSWTVPAGGPGDPHARLVVFTVARATSQPGTLAAQVALTSRQGCPASSASSVRPAALPAPKVAHAGVAVTPAPAHFPTVPVAGGSFLAALVLAAIVARRLRHRGTHGRRA